jgi:hypothetical protein
MEIVYVLTVFFVLWVIDVGVSKLIKENVAFLQRQIDYLNERVRDLENKQ